MDICEKENMLYEGLFNYISGFACENDMSNCQIIGILEMLKQDFINMNNQDNEE